MRRTIIAGITLMVLGGCGSSPITGADGVELVKNIASQLGFLVHADKAFREAGYEATPEHGGKGDDCWRRLMLGLQRYGYSPEIANPGDIKKNKHRPTIALMKPIGPHEYIRCTGGGELQGACYFSDRARMEVPGNYTTSTLTERPWSQPLMHEELHYFCDKWLGKNCLDKNGKHFHPAPDGSGRNIWDLTWERSNDSLAHQQYLEQFHQGMELHGMSQYQ